MKTSYIKSLALASLLSIYPFFVANNFFKFYLILLITVIPGLRKLKLNKKDFKKIVVLFFIYFYVIILDIENIKSNYFIIMLPFIFIFMISKYKLLIVNDFVNIYTFFLSLSIISNLLIILGFQKYIYITSFNVNNINHSVYFFTVVRDSGVAIYNSGLFSRFYGIFFEPGFIGTISALILVSGITYKNNKKLFLANLIGGLLTFSLAFYAILIIANIFRLSSKKIFILLASLFIIVNMINYVNNPTLNYYTIDRINSSDRLNNRNGKYEKKQIELVRNIYTNGDITKILFGTNFFIGSTGSYRYLLLKYGLVGITLYIIFYLLIIFEFKNQFKKKGIIGFYIAYIASIYQRPYIDNYYMIILWLLPFYAIYNEKKRGLNKCLKKKKYLQ